MFKLATIQRQLYTLFFFCALPFIFLRLVWRSRNNRDYRLRFGERLGIFKAPLKKGGIWIHSVSVGESMAAIAIIKAFQKQFPHIPVTVTTTTPTGSKVITSHLGHHVFHVYLPFDLPFSVALFLNRISPNVAMIMETELWPNCFKLCEKRNIPIIIANARLSNASIVGYQRIKPFMKEVLSSVTLIAAQSEIDGNRFLSLGLPPEKLAVLGNVKYDMTIPKDIEQHGAQLRETWGKDRPVFIAASTHAGEEELILKAFGILRGQFNNLLLILVPRHRERFERVAELIRKEGYTFVTRSSGTMANRATEVFLGDTMGELLLMYAASDVAFVGGSFVPVGGHNTLEPAMLNVACVVGPYVHNFKEITHTLKEVGALTQVDNEHELTGSLYYLLTHPDKRALVGEQGRKVVEDNRGAIGRLLEKVAVYF